MGAKLLFAAIAFTGTQAFASDTGECRGAGGDGQCVFINGPAELGTEAIRFEAVEHDYFQTTKPLSFVDSAGANWSAPAGTVTDGASIPGVFVPLVGERTSSQFLNAATMHDAYCGQGNDGLTEFQSRQWQDVHAMFYDALIVNGTQPLKAKIMYAAVYLGGPRWDDPQRGMSQVSDELLVQEMEWCMRWIEETNPTRERIERWMGGREDALRAGSPVEPDFAALRREAGLE